MKGETVGALREIQKTNRRIAIDEEQHQKDMKSPTHKVL